jgi:hypothetical protein
LERRRVMRDHPIGVFGQTLGRGLEPRFSNGTLQLSIRCSSIHFLPRRSFPVSVSGEVLDSGTGSLRRQLSCAVAGDARQIARTAPIVPMNDDRMRAPQFGSWSQKAVACSIKQQRDFRGHPEPVAS